MSLKHKSNEEILELIAERDRFLELHPELKPFQKDIDFVLHQAGSDPKMRLIKLSALLTDLINDELKPELKRLKELIDQSTDAKVLPIRRKAK